ncbi:MOSC domain-containing protein [Rhodobacteraceae bacterium B1Z28]|uniref:MOSC domain-containing protein n=1 Tax=Ruegeria haliotis TaxID=2747601 RepID=A0ABX2PKQ0_9RHOB|nr:MOSC domain-containing protein [Ruegeria haliotis]NVO54698.1 MOSC domain-containing protein [Ruegeria haliotis]
MSKLTITCLSRFPVKGLSAEPLNSVTLRASEGVPGDRLFGFARYNSGFDPRNPEPLPKDRFVVLLKEAALAGLQTHFDSQSHVLQVKESANTHWFEMRTQQGRADAAKFLHRVLALSDPEPPIFVSSEPHRFTDVSVVSPAMMNAISLLNIASVNALGQKLKTEINPARFRANIEIDGLAPFAELNGVGAILKFGNVRLRILSRTKRCAATEVNPDTAIRDLKLPYLIRQQLGHTDMGVYVEVAEGGTLRLDQPGKMCV